MLNPLHMRVRPWDAVKKYTIHKQVAPWRCKKHYTKHVKEQQTTWTKNKTNIIITNIYVHLQNPIRNINKEANEAKSSYMQHPL